MASQIDSSRKEYLFELPKMEDSRGNLSFLEEGGQIPFKIARVYWIYDVPGGQTRGNHAFRSQDEIIIALSGSFDVMLNDGATEHRYSLNRAYKALYVPSKMWRTLANFATNSVCLVISSGKYDETEYLRNFREFKRFLKNPSTFNLSDNNRTIPPFTLDDARQKEHNSIFDCSLTELPVIRNRAGNLTPIHNSVEIPFDVKRVFFVYDIPYGKTRGIHAHINCHEYLLAVGGSFDVELDDGINKRTVNLNRPTQGLHVLPGIWIKETNYSSGAVCLVLTSQKYSEDDYIRKYSDFKRLYGNRS